MGTFSISVDDELETNVVFLRCVAGDLEAFKKQAFVLKEGVEYRIKISFKVRDALAEFTSVHRCFYILCLCQCTKSRSHC